jgi:ATP-dependent Zn protease
MISGPFVNPDIMEEPDIIDVETTMQQLVMQTTAIRIDLKNVIIGQDEAINKMEKAYFHTEKAVILSQKKSGPRNVYLFAGPPGVGKTFMAETFAKTLAKPFRRFDMAGYADQNCVEEIAGISTFWKNAKPGVLTSFVKENPKCVLLFDEIEKAHATVIRLFLQILDEGACFDRFYDTNVSFKNVIIIFTTNAGKQLYDGRTNENLTLLPDRVAIGALEKDMNQETKTPYFPPEIVSRMSAHTIIMFNHLKADAIRKVIKKDAINQIEDTEKVYGYHLGKGRDYLVSTVQFSVGVGTDARNASRLSGKVIDRELYKFLALVEEKYGLDKKESIEQIWWEVDFTGVSEEIKEFYYGESNCVIAIFGEVEDIICEHFQKNNVLIKSTTDIEKFMEIIHKENVIAALIDYEYGLDEGESSLSIIYAKSEGKNVLRRISIDGDDIPKYILFDEYKYQYSEREKLELCNKGIAGFIEQRKLESLLVEIYEDVCCQKAMETLLLRHQVLTYETRNELDIESRIGKIIFSNLKLEMAVDAEDKSFLLTDDLRPEKRWSDICVNEDVKKELTYFIDFLQNPKEYIRKGVRSPKGVLMYGPPGTGKTSLAKVVASESNINFLSFSADEMEQRGAEYVHYLFRVARKYAPVVFFIDEIDAIGVTRGYTANSTLNALLTEMDGFKKVDNKPVFIMAATNIGAAIDPALARRFDRSFCVDLPDQKVRRWILERLIKNHSNMFTVSTEEVESISERSIGMSPAALENVIETALREGIRSDKQVDDSMLDEVFERYHYGEEKEINSIEEIRQTAFHEAGHALIQMYYGRKPDYLSVIARGNFGGYVLTTERDMHPTKEKLLQRICAALGGRAAELEFGYGLTSGAAADLKAATKIATKMVCEYGMYENEVGIAVILEDEQYNYPDVKKLINRILEDQLKEARSIVDEHRDAMNRLVNEVMSSEQKYLTQKEILDAYKGEEGDRK